MSELIDAIMGEDGVWDIDEWYTKYGKRWGKVDVADEDLDDDDVADDDDADEDDADEDDSYDQVADDDVEYIDDDVDMS